MAHQKYTTRALVLTVFDRNGSDRVVRLFTERAGVVDARATAVREEKSKLRYALQPFSLVRVSLVRGKREWRLAGAEAEQNLFLSAPNRESRGALVRSFRLLERLVRGEEENRELYVLVEEGVQHLVTAGGTYSENVFSFRMLSMLGYIAPPHELTPLVSAPTLREACCVASALPLNVLTQHIDEALAVSHL